MDLISTSEDGLKGSNALLDSGAHLNYISEDLVLLRQIPVVKKLKSYPVVLADKNTRILVEFETIPIWLVISLHQERIVFDVMSTMTYPLIIGLSWLRLHNPVVDWRLHTINFSRCGCYETIISTQVDCLDVLSLGSVVASVIRIGEGMEDEESFDGLEGDVKNSAEFPVVYL